MEIMSCKILHGQICFMLKILTITDIVKIVHLFYQILITLIFLLKQNKNNLINY